MEARQQRPRCLTPGRHERAAVEGTWTNKSVAQHQHRHSVANGRGTWGSSYDEERHGCGLISIGADILHGGSMHTRHADLEVSGSSRRLPLFGRLSQPSLDSENYSHPAHCVSHATLYKVADDSPADHPMQHHIESVMAMGQVHGYEA
jgi:hypothetical protein